MDGQMDPRMMAAMQQQGPMARKRRPMAPGMGQPAPMGGIGAPPPQQAFKKGGAVKGCGCATRGVKKCKVR